MAVGRRGVSRYSAPPHVPCMCRFALVADVLAGAHSIMSSPARLTTWRLVEPGAATMDGSALVALLHEAIRKEPLAFSGCRPLCALATLVEQILPRWQQTAQAVEPRVQPPHHRHRQSTSQVELAVPASQRYQRRRQYRRQMARNRRWWLTGCCRLIVLRSMEQGSANLKALAQALYSCVLRVSGFHSCCLISIRPRDIATALDGSYMVGGRSASPITLE